MYAYMHQEAKKHNWTPCEDNLMHYVYAGISYYEEHPSKADISAKEKKDTIIEALQTTIVNNSSLSPIDAEMCLELIDGPIISQAINYALYNNLELSSQTRTFKKKPLKKKKWKLFCCF